MTGPGFCVSWFDGCDLFRALGSVSCGLVHDTAGGIDTGIGICVI